MPITVAVGEPIEPTLPPAELTALLHSRMQHLLERVQDAYGPHPPGEFWVPHRLGRRSADTGRGQPDGRRGGRREGRAPRATCRPPGRRGSRMEPVFPHAGDRRQGGDQGHRDPDHLHGLENIPVTGGAVIAINHTSYIDLVPAALAAHHRSAGCVS